MRIDPVVALIDEIERAYAALASARDVGDWPATHGELARIALLHGTLARTEPASALGAAHLLREAASMLPRAQRPYLGDGLREIAGRLADGERRNEDLIHLRTLCRALASGARGATGEAAAGLIALALKGAARPVVLWRAVTAPAPGSEMRATCNPAC